MAIIPIGSGNGLARHLNIPLDIINAINCINKQQCIQMDTIAVNDKAILGIGGYGFDAVVAEKFDKHHRRGLKAYIYLVFREFFKFNPINVSIDLDGKVKTLIGISLYNCKFFTIRKWFHLIPKIRCHGR